MANEVQVTVVKRVLHLTFDRSEKLNAINLPMWEAMNEATRRLREDDGIGALLLTANGRYFSAGIDLHGPLAPESGLGDHPSAFRRWYRRGTGSLHQLGDEWESIEKPVVVGFQGPVLGGALELALCADFRLATPDARLGLPEIMLGALPGSGGISRLARLAGPHWARWLVLANRQIDAQRGLMIGVIHDILPAEGFAAACVDFCHELTALPCEAFAAGKLAIEIATDLDRAQARHLERLAVSGLVGGAEHRGAIGAVRQRLRKTD